MTPYFETKLGKLYHGDCLEIIPGLELESVDLVLTDPPYPTEYTKEYKFNKKTILLLNDINSKQLIFWTPQDKDKFPLSYSCFHIWDKKTGVRSQFELIYERNGGTGYRVYNVYLLNSTVAAKYLSDVFTGHKSQKPRKLITKLLHDSKTNNTVFDPFLGSGTTAVVCERSKRKWIGIEIEEKYCEMAAKRIEESLTVMERIERSEKGITKKTGLLF